MRNIKLIVQYDGSSFSGWQIQANARTVQGELSSHLRTILAEPVKISSAARTDAGVHAWGTACNFSTESDIPLISLQRALNSMFRGEASVRSVEAVPATFHARHCATSRLYRYTLLNQDFPDAFHGRYSLLIRRPLAIRRMRECAALLIGEHDFSSFRSAHCQASSPIRRMIAAWIEQRAPFIHVYFRANAFLQQMIRIVVGTILLAGRETIDADGFRAIMLAKRREAAGPTVAPRGLCLIDVSYGAVPGAGCLPDPPTWP